MSAAYFLVATSHQPVARWIVIVLAGVALYWAGMILNDVFDIDRDRQQRPTRPIAAGKISLGSAKVAGWGLLALGVVLGAIAGFLPGENHPTTIVPLGVAATLAVVIVAYDGPLKKTFLAPAAMGCCRFLSFLLGASPLIAVGTENGWLFPIHVIAIAMGLGIYIMGITSMAREEASGGPSPLLQQGLMFVIIGAAVLAFAPQTARGDFAWHMAPDGKFPIMIGLIAFPVILRGIRAVNDPTPAKIQTTIRVGVLTIIPLAAAFAFLGAGPIYGLGVFALAIPSITLASRFRVT